MRKGESYPGEGYEHARKLYIETGDLDALENMISLVTMEGDYWKIAGDDPNITNPSPLIDITLNWGSEDTHI